MNAAAIGRRNTQTLRRMAKQQGSRFLLIKNGIGTQGPQSLDTTGSGGIEIKGFLAEHKPNPIETLSNVLASGDMQVAGKRQNQWSLSFPATQVSEKPSLNDRVIDPTVPRAFNVTDVKSYPNAGGGLLSYTLILKELE